MVMVNVKVRVEIEFFRFVEPWFFAWQWHNLTLEGVGVQEIGT